jgi:uncharacterized membrane protein YfcA
MVVSMEFLFGPPALAAWLASPDGWWIWPVLFAAALGAGLVDTIAGGGGMITLPALLAAGLPPQLALGTNKLQSSFGSLTATLRFRSAGLVSLRSILPGILATALGAGLGALVVGRLDPGFLRLLIPFCLVGILVFLLFKPEFGSRHAAARWPARLFWPVAGLVLGFYDGFFGPGTGTFWAMALVGLAGMDLRAATAHTKAVNFTSNLVSLAVFLTAGSVVLALGLLMGLGQAAGAWIGSHLVLKRGTGLVRRLVLAVTAVMIAYLLAKAWLGGG